MSLPRFFYQIIVSCFCISMLLACSGQVSDDSQNVLHRGNSGEPLTLDPHKLWMKFEHNIVGDMFIGLFTENHLAEPVPGMAESWVVSTDGLTWTFTLRQAQWSDGEPVTAYDFEYGFQRFMDPETNAKYTSLMYFIKNSEAVNTGQLSRETLGVQAIDAKTLQLQLEHPAPYLPALLTQPMGYPLPKHLVEKVGDIWIQPRNIVTNGPYVLKDWKANDFILLERNDLFWDNADVCIDQVFYYPTVDSAEAEKRVRKGDLHINNGFTDQNIEFLSREIPDYIRVFPHLANSYVTFNIAKKPFSDVRVRHALSMAINRQFITNEIMRAGQQPAEAFIPPNVNGYPGTARISWIDENIALRKEKARQLLREAGFGPENPLSFEFSYRNNGSNPEIAPVIQQDFESIADWVNVEIIGFDSKYFYENLYSGDFDTGYPGWIGDYNDAYSFLFFSETNAGSMNYGGWSNRQYDELLAQANTVLDPEERGRLLNAAEQILLDEMVYAPISFDVTKVLVNPKVTGWKDNVLLINKTRYLCLED